MRALALGARRRGWAARPTALGLVLGAGLIGAFLLYELALGRLALLARTGENAPEVRIALIHCIFLAYLPAACAATVRGAEDAVVALRELFRGSAGQWEAWRRRMRRFDARWLALVALPGIVLAISGPYLAGTEGSPWNPYEWIAEVYWHRVGGILVGILLAVFTGIVIAESRRLSAFAAELGAVDLLDQRPLAPFARQGLSNALLAVGSFAIFSLFLYDQGVTWLMAVAAALTVVTAFAALFLPLHGIHRVLARRKAEELAWCRAAIRSETERLRATTPASGEGRLADVVAYETLVQRASEWPITTSTYLRLAIYLLIPLGSWMASQLVQAALERWVLAR